MTLFNRIRYWALNEWAQIKADWYEAGYNSKYAYRYPFMTRQEAETHIAMKNIVKAQHERYYRTRIDRIVAERER